ncbi:hypothetical protein E5S67_06185 [Microcoleus sp. IPMA8]|uniref:Uncharacterized protein n=1 Tax=Microcoleus asticus IPMA8 TaxID=2563858 RepID=A0ABX2D938_9CYAN|nr:hypothetical protein [Microcoleus asticus IPMA8]
MRGMVFQSICTHRISVMLLVVVRNLVLKVVANKDSSSLLETFGMFRYFSHSQGQDTQKQQPDRPS